MKKIIRIAALLMVAVFALAALASCGKSMDTIKENIKDLNEDKYVTLKMDRDEKKSYEDYIEDDLDVDLEGKIETGYRVSSVSGDAFAVVVEFEESVDAKEYAKAILEYFEDYEDDEMYEDAVCERSGNIVIAATDEKLLKKIWN